MACDLHHDAAEEQHEGGEHDPALHENIGHGDACITAVAYLFEAEWHGQDADADDAVGQRENEAQHAGLDGNHLPFLFFSASVPYGR